MWADCTNGEAYSRAECEAEQAWSVPYINRTHDVDDTHTDRPHKTNQHTTVTSSWQWIGMEKPLHSSPRLQLEPIHQHRKRGLQPALCSHPNNPNGNMDGAKEVPPKVLLCCRQDAHT